jgi:heavy metal translocating P-type ATPase
MSKAIRNDYLLVALTALALGVGLAARFSNLETLSLISLGFGAAIGLILSIALLVAAIRHGEFGSDVLALISILATALTNEWIAASVIAVMLSGGRALESWAEGRARGQLESLLARAPRSAHRIQGTGEISEVLLSELAIGDRILVRNGEVVPIDGSLASDGTFDESALTGEPLPVFRATGEEVSSGVLNSGAEVEITATNTSENSTYSNLIRLVAQAQASSAAGVRIANKWAVRFVPFAIGLAGAAWLISGQVSNAVAVIVAATPCPLILAVPVAIISGMSKAASRGAIVKGGAALESLARVKTVLLDKTGTLTQGGPEISEIKFAPGSDENLALALAGSLEQSSPHVVAKAIVLEAKSRGLMLERATEVFEEHGTGLRGLVAGRDVYVGQPEHSLPDWASSQHSLMVAVVVDGNLEALIGLDDPLRTEAAGTIAKLRKLGIERIAMVSGDRRSAAQEIADELGLDEVFAECKPEDKLEIVRAEMAAISGTVIAVGDGINDAPALAAATVGVAMGARGATAASEAADVVIVEDSIEHLADAIDVAQGARGRALQAAGVGMTLATAAMLLGAVGILNATASAVTQEFIDAAAILWALVPPKSRIRKQ